MSSKLAFTVRKYHKWLSLLVGLQALLWLAGGVYMVVMDLDFIHGDHLVQRMHESLPSSASKRIPFEDIRLRFPQAHEIVLTNWQGKPHYLVHQLNGSTLIDARDGERRSPLSEVDAKAVSLYHYTGKGAVVAANLLTDTQDAPTEIQGGALPLWQVKFDDFGSTTFYISPSSGMLVKRRHTFWRVFDFVWMLHIMDYESRANINNNLFRVAATVGLIMSIFGLWLLYFSFRKKRGANETLILEGEEQ